MRIAVLDDYQRVALDMADWSQLGSDCTVDVFDRHLGAGDALVAALAPYGAVCLMRERTVLDAAVLERLPDLKLVVATGAKTSAIDLEAAAARGITVCRTRPGESRAATTELAWGLMIAALRHLPQEHARMRAGGWQETVGGTLAGRRLGILGLGRLGTAMVPVAHAFGMETLAWSPNLTDARAAEAGTTRVDREAFFAGADIVTVHMALGPGSRGLVGAAELAAMKPSAILINTSRGPVVDEAALVAALEARRIAAAGLDVYDAEPLPAEHPLRRLDNVVLSPHLGFVVAETYRQWYADTVEAIAAWRAGNPVRVLAAAS